MKQNLFKFILLTLCLCSTILSAQNPPYATILEGPVQNGPSFDFTVRLDPNVLPDCNFYTFDCNEQGIGLQSVQIHWILKAYGNCADCTVSGDTVQMGSFPFGFWGTTSVLGSSDFGTDCSNPGGTDRTLSVFTKLCNGLEYELITYAFNPLYDKGVISNGSDFPGGPYRCCGGYPSFGSIDAMQECNDDVNGWLNPSRPQSYFFDFQGTPVPPAFSVDANIDDGDVVDCGYNLQSTMNITPNAACIKSTLIYQTYLNGTIVQTETADCINAPFTFDSDYSLAACPELSCILPDNALEIPCGVNTIRWEAFEDCPDAVVASREITFTVECPEADELEVSDDIICPNETVTVSVVTPANVSIPYENGTYEMHFNNTSPYENPNTNYIGSGQTQVLTNDGTLPYNEELTVIGTVWENFDTSGPLGCETTAMASETFIFLEEISLNVELQACNFNAINITATGGYPAYDANTGYAYDAGALGNNTTGIFDNVVTGIYDVTVSDDFGCNAVLQVEVNAGIEVTLSPVECNDFNTFSLNVDGGQPSNPSYDDLTLYNITSDIDGLLGSPNANGDFTATNVSAGNHTLTIAYEHLNLDGSPSGIFCSEIRNVDIFDETVITLNEDPCLFFNQVVIDEIVGGDNSDYTVFLSTQAAPNSTNDVMTNEGSLSGAGTLTGVSAGNYHVVVEDGRGCLFSVPIEVKDNSDAAATIGTTCEANTIEVSSENGSDEWTYYLVNVGGNYENATDLVTTPISATVDSPNNYSGTFSNIVAGNYEVVAVSDLGCTVLTAAATAYDAIVLEQASFCEGGDIGVSATGGYASATNGSFTYVLSDANGTVLEQNTTGVFSGYTPATYTITAYDGKPNTADALGCSENIEIELFETLSLEFEANPCNGNNSATITNISGGSGIEYTVFLTETEGSLNVATSENGLPLTFTTTNINDFPYTFLNLIPQTAYYIVASSGITNPETNELCTTSFGPISAAEAPEATAEIPACGEFNSVSVSVSETNGPYDFFLYEGVDNLQGGPNLPTQTYDQDAAVAGAANSTLGFPLAALGVPNNITFSNVAVGNYTLYSLDADACIVAETLVQAYNEMEITLGTASCATNSIEVLGVTGGHDPFYFSDATNYILFLSTNDIPNATNNVSSNEGQLNGDGTFTNVADGSYFVIAEDDRGCQTSLPVTVGSDVSLSFSEANCDTPTGSAIVTGEGGQNDWNFYLYENDGDFDENNPQNGNGWVASDLADGSGNDNTGDFSGVAGGDYTVYGVDAGDCVTSLSGIKIYDALSIEIAENNCGLGNIEVTNVSGGSDPSIFADGDYTVFVSTTAAPNATNNVTTNEGTLSGTGTFTGLNIGDYHVVLEDANGCQTSVPVSILSEASITQLPTNDCALNISVQTTGGTANWTFYLYAGNGNFDAENPENAGNGWLSTVVGTSENIGTFENLENGTYSVYALDANNCEQSLADIVLDANNLLTIENNSDLCDYGTVSLAASGGTSPYTYTLVNLGGTVFGTNTTGSFTGVFTDTYNVNVEDANGCSGTLEISVSGEALDIVTPYNCEAGFVATGGTPPYTYQLWTNSLSPTLVAESENGAFPDIDGGEYLLYVTDVNDCLLNVLVECEPQVCDLEATATTECVDENSYNLIVSLSGTGIYTIAYGNETLTGQTAGDITLSGFANGDYDISITDENLADCSQNLTGTNDCAGCDLSVSYEIECVDAETFELILTIEGSGTYDISNGLFPFTDYSAGTYTFDFSNGNTYTLSVYDPNDETCTESITFNNTEDCAECDLQASAITECLNNDTYNVVITLSGTSTYNITDGLHFPINNQTAGEVIMGPFPNGNYTINIVDTNDPTCTQTLTGSESCFECGLQVSVTTECIDTESFNAAINIVGEGTFAISSGFTTISGLSAGTENITFLNGDVDLTVTSEQDPSCFENVSFSEDCFLCDLQASAITQCIDSENYNVVVTFSGSGEYNISDGINAALNNVSAGTYTLGPIPNGDYNIEIITNNVLEECTEVLTGTNDCFECEIQVSSITECVDANSYNVILNLNAEGFYTINDGVNPPLTNQTAGVITVGPIPNGDYSITVTNEQESTCFETVSGTKDCFECELEVSYTTECTSLNGFDLNVTIAGNNTYTITNGNVDLTGFIAGTYTISFLNGGHTLEITDEDNVSCSETISFEEDCAICDVEASATTACLNDESYSVLLTLSGTDTYTVSDGVNAPLTNQAAGQIVVGPFENGTYSITITSENVEDCEQIITGEDNCFECDLEVSYTTECTSLEGYDLALTISGTGTYTLNNGLGTINGLTSGTQTISLLNGETTLEVFSEIDNTCIETINVNEDCAICDFTASGTAECVDNSFYNVNINVVGFGTFTISDGINPPLTNVSAGTVSVGPIPSGDYSITVTQEQLEDCEQVITGTNECFECEFEASVGTSCAGFLEYNLFVELFGLGTYTLEASNGEVLTGQDSGIIFLGLFENGDYSVTVTSEIDETCFTVLSGNEDCFVCQLEASATPECINPSSYNVDVTFSGEGNYTISDDINPPLTGQTEGTYTFGPYDSLNDYNISIVSEQDETCVQEFSGVQDCFECVLPTSATAVCVDDENYQVAFTITGTGTYSINDGTDVQTGVEAGVIALGPYPNGDYSILITSEFDETCNTILSGESDCFVCDLEVSASTACLSEEFYTVNLNLQGSGTYTLDAGNTSAVTALTGQSSGLIPFGPFANGAYNITITSEADPTCTTNISGIEDCFEPFECDLTASATTLCNAIGPNPDTENYLVNVNLQGTGTYLVSSSTGDFLTGQTAGDILMGPFPNGVYNIFITSDENEECNVNISGTEDCTQEIICDPSVSTQVNCIDLSSYEVTLSLTGTGSFTIDDGINTPLTNQTAGEIVVGPFPSGDFSIEIFSEQNETCNLVASGTGLCSFTCDLTVNSEIVCNENGTYNVVLDIDGESTYTVLDGLGSPIPNVSAGVIELGPYPDNTYYEVSVINQSNSFCNQTIGGLFVCEPEIPCDLVVTLDPTCINGVLFIFMTIEGSSVYTVYDGIPSTPITGLTAGVYEFDQGSSPVFEYYRIVDENNPDCTYELELGNGCDGNCDLFASHEVVCQPDGSYNLFVYIEGTGTYDIDLLAFFDSDNIDNAGAGTYVFENMTVDDFSLDIDQNGFGLCQAEINGSGACEPFEICDLAMSLTTNCITTNNDLQFILEVEISGSGSYILDDGFGNIIEDISAGIYELGPYAFGEGVAVQVYDSNPLIFNCFAASFVAFTCEEICDSDQTDFEVSYETECFDDNSYMLFVTVEGDLEYDISDGFAFFLNGVPAGTYEFGPYDEDFFFFVVVNIAGNPECFQDFFGNSNCNTVTECDLNATIEPVCAEDGNTYELEITVNGTGIYTIEYGDSETINNVELGQYSLGPFQNGPYEVVVFDSSNNSCKQVFEGSNFCEEPPVCDLSVEAQTVCIDDFSYTVELNISGTSTYTIYADDFPVVTGISANVLTIGNYANDTPYDLKVVDEDDNVCFQAFSGTFSCFQGTACDLSASVSVDCISTTGSYFLMLNLQGSSTYTILSEFGGDVFGQTAGTVILGPFTQDFYDIFIIDESNDNCAQNVFGNSTCVEPNCDLDVILDFECVNENEYNVLVTVLGTGTYNIYDGLEVGFPFGTDLLLENVTLGQYIVGPFENGTSRILVLDPNNTDCFVDFINFRNCEDPTQCDLDSSVETFCNEDGTFDVLITVGGTSEYEVSLFDSWGGPLITEQNNVTGGTVIQMGPVTTGEYYVFIQDQEFGPCDQDFRGTTECATEPCDLSTNVQVICENNDSYSLFVTITGSGTYTVDGGFGIFLDDAEAGEYTFGPFPNFFGFYEIFVASNANDDCFSGASGVLDCDAPPVCDLNATAVLDCISGDTYNLTLTVEGSGSYNIFSNAGEAINVPAGEYTVGPFSLNTYEILIEDTNDPNCFSEVTGTESCVANCDLDATAATICVDESSFSLAINLFGNSTYIIDDGSGLVLVSQTAGLIDVGMYLNGSYNITITDEANPLCSQNIVGNKSCLVPPNCDLQATAQTVCVGEENYNLTLNITGSSTYIVDAGANGILTNQTAGNIVLENLPNGFYDIMITDENNGDCFQTVAGVEDCTIPFVCDLLLEADAVCLNAETYEVQITLTGAGTYTVSDGLNADLTGQTAGNIVLGPFPNGSYNITVTDEAEANCFQNVSGIKNCVEPPTCDLQATAETSCTDVNSYQVILTLTGSSTYTVSDGINAALTAQTAGTVVIGPIPNGNYAITITDENNAICFQNISGSKDCEQPLECDLSLSSQTECIDEENFNVLINLTGSGIYTVSDGVNEDLAGQTAGEITVGPLPNGIYEITITDQTQENCFQTISGSNSCLPNCDLGAIATAECFNNAFYSLNVVLSGSSTYSINDGVNEVLTGQTAGNITLGPIPNGFYNITITDEINQDCSIALSGLQSCLPTCDLEATATATCTENGNYQLVINLEGTSTYNINDGINSPLTAQTAGEIMVGEYASGAYNILITDEDNLSCAINIVGTQDCIEDLESGIGQLVFYDLNENGIFDEATESGLADVTVTLIEVTEPNPNASSSSPPDVVVATTVTDENGYYLFPNVAAGDYYLTFEILNGFVATLKDQGTDDSIDSDINELGETDIFTIAEMELMLDKSAGFFANPVCDDFAVEFFDICEGTNGYLIIAIDGGQSPYTVSVGGFFNETFTEEDLPLEAIGPIQNLVVFDATVVDANNCTSQIYTTSFSCGTVAVELLDFSGLVLEEGNLLKWITASETNNDFFTLMHSTNSTDFEAIATIDGAGTTNTTLAYEHLHKEAPNGISYYRLDQTDFDGTTTASNIVSLIRTEYDFSIVNILPVPASNTIDVVFTTDQKTNKVQAVIYDVLGRKVIDKTILINSFANNLQFDIAHFAVGTYILTLQNGEKMVSKKFVKE